jgi:hypothetical protein
LIVGASAVVQMATTRAARKDDQEWGGEGQARRKEGQ